MPELMVRVVEQLGKPRGEVIVIHRDGHGWSVRERQDVRNRIIRVPDLNPTLQLQLMTPQLADRPMSPTDPRRMQLFARAYRLDVAKLPSLEVMTSADVQRALIQASHPAKWRGVR